MDDPSLLRYSRQIMLPEIDASGQQRLLDARSLIIGAGGLGSPASLYLAAAGVGHIVISDPDRVDLSNLQRQIIHTTASVGRRKVDSAAEALRALNPDCTVTPEARRLDGDELLRAVEDADVVLDCSDNFATRFAVNAACVATTTPLVSGAVIRWEGQVSVFTGKPGEPCYRCLYGTGDELEESCAETGIIAPLAGVIGAVQALEALKCLTLAGQGLVGRVLVLDALSMTWRTLRLRKDPDCPVCKAAGQ